MSEMVMSESTSPHYADTDKICLALHRGFDAGNYGSAYTSGDLDTVWEVVEDGEQHDECRSAAPEAFRAAFVIGFFGSYEDDEVPSEHLDELLEAHRTYGAWMCELGIAVDARDGEALT